MIYIASLSGGQDSTAMTVRLLEHGHRIDYILFFDTGYEFPQMYEYISKIDAWLRKTFGIGVTTLKPTTSIEEWAFSKVTRGENKGRYRGLPKKVGMDYCTRELKTYRQRNFIETIDRSIWPKLLTKEDEPVRLYIGYTARENRSMSCDFATVDYPLKWWGWNEPEVRNYLREMGLYNELYEYFHRTGCYLCPKQNLDSWYAVYLHYPKEWEYSKALERRAKELDCVVQTFRDDYSLEELEVRFSAQKIKEQQTPQLILEWNDEQVSCFCK